MAGAQYICVKLVQVPVNTAWFKLVVVPSILFKLIKCWLVVATKENHTSSSALPTQPFGTLDGPAWIKFPEPYTSQLPPSFAKTGIAVIQSSFSAGNGGFLTQTVNLAKSP